MIAGKVSDEAGRALANKVIHLRIESDDTTTRATTRSGEDGDFVYQLQSSPVSYASARVTAVLEGDQTIDGAETSLVVSRTAKPHAIRVYLPAGNRIDLDLPTADIRITIEGDATEAVNLDVRNEHDELIGSGALTPARPLTLEVPTTRLGALGYGQLRVSAREEDGSTQLLDAIDVMRFRTSRLQLVRPSSPPLTITGAITDKAGHPLAQQTIAIVADDVRVATVLSDEQGTFSLTPDGFRRAAAQVRVKAIHESATPWWIGGVSELNIEMGDQHGSRPWWPIAVLAAASIAGLAWRQRARETTPRRRKAGAEGQESEPLLPVASSGATSIHGAIVDSVSLEPIIRAELHVAGHQRTASDAWGRFHIVELPRGHHVLHVHAAGYEDQSVPFAVPHSGRWHHALVKMRSLRNVALAHYRRGVPPLPGVDDATHSHTAQELLAIHGNAASQSAREILEDLTLAFETAYYAGDQPTTSLVERVRRNADAVEQERRARIV